MQEERRFLDYLKSAPKYNHWYPIFLVMIRTGMRVGECTGLRWRDIDFDEGTININHTLVYYARELSNGCYFAINSTKTVASQRIIPMSAEVKEAFLQEKAYQEELGLQSQSVVCSRCARPRRHINNNEHICRLHQANEAGCNAKISEIL